MASSRSYKRYRQYLSGKRVALIGPAAHLKDAGCGPQIDLFDIVVRINNGLIWDHSFHHDYGSRTDVLYTYIDRDNSWLKHRIYAWNSMHIKYIYVSFPRRSAYRRAMSYIHEYDYKPNMPVIYPSSATLRKWEDMSAYLGSRPTAGLFAVFDLLLSDLALLYVTGMTFSNNYPATYTGHKVQGRQRREDCDRDFAYIKEVLSLDPRFNCDAILLDLLNI